MKINKIVSFGFSGKRMLTFVLSSLFLFNYNKIDFVCKHMSLDLFK